MKSWLQDNDIEMSSAHYEGKSVVTERFTITLKNIFYKYMTSASKYIYINKLDGVLNKYNKTCHSAINLNFVIMYECQNIKTFLPKITFQIGRKKFKVKNTVTWTCVISDLKDEEIVGTKTNCIK